MATLDELLQRHGVDATATAPSSARGKLLAQADRMLKELSQYTSVSQLDGTSTKFWWAPQAVNGKRKISARYGNKVVQGFAAYADNDLESVRALLETFRAVIEESDDSTWAAEEARRKSSTSR